MWICHGTSTLPPVETETLLHKHMYQQWGLKNIFSCLTGRRAHIASPPLPLKLLPQTKCCNARLFGNAHRHISVGE